MAEKDYKFTLGKLRGTAFPMPVWEKFQELLYKDEDASFSIGDIVVNLGVQQAWLCMSAVPDKCFNELIRRCVLPSVRRYSDMFSDPLIKDCLDMVHNHICKNEIDLKDLEIKSTSLFEQSTEIQERRLSQSYELVYFVSRLIWNKEYTTIEEAAGVMFIVDQMHRGNTWEREQQKHDLLMMFPPIIKQYHVTQEVFYSEAIVRPKKNWFLKLLKFKQKDGNSYEFKWGTFTPNWGLVFELIEFSKRKESENHSWYLAFLFIFGKFWIPLPKWLPKRQFSEMGQTDIRHWGFATGAGMGGHNIVFRWNKIYKPIEFPWALTHVRTEHLMLDGSWQTEPKWDSVNPTREDFEAQVAKEIHSFKYVLRNGTVQYRLATIHVKEWEWRYKWLRYIPIFRHISRRIDIEFSNEIGERSGSWKGGTMGTAYKMLPNELPSEALYRFQETYKSRRH